jgi:hypothetical protein
VYRSGRESSLESSVRENKKAAPSRLFDLEDWIFRHAVLLSSGSARR